MEPRDRSPRVKGAVIEQSPAFLGGLPSGPPNDIADQPEIKSDSVGKLVQPALEQRLNTARLQLLKAKLKVLKAAKTAQVVSSHRMKQKPVSSFSFVDKTIIQYEEQTQVQKKTSTSSGSFDGPKLRKWNKYRRVDSPSAVESDKVGPSGDSAIRVAAEFDQMRVLNDIRSLGGLICLELCAGSANLSCALRNCGFQAIAVDHSKNAHRPKIHCVQIDLAAVGAFSLIKAILEEPHVFYVHMAPPCGTASAARNRPVDPRLVAKGFPSPPPLRSHAEPMGLRGLSVENQRRVDQANAIYSVCAKVMALCIEKSIIVSVENPARSLFWQVPYIKHFEGAKELQDTFFHHCMHGGER